MSVGSAARATLSTAAQRRRARGWRNALEPERLVPLGVAILVVLLGALLVSIAKNATLRDTARAMSRGEVWNLNAVRDAAALEPALATVFDSPGDRRFAAERIAIALQGERGRTLPNVGAIAALREPAAPLAARRDLESFRIRAAAAIAAHARLDARAQRRSGEPTIPLVTPEQLRDLKPRFVVRTPGEFQRTFLLAVVVLVLAFLAMHAGAHALGRRGDPLLLPIAALLTGIGFAELTGLRDPLRDQMLFARFAEGALLGACGFVAATLPLYERSVLRRLSLLPLALALLLAALLVVLGQGPSGSDAKVNLFGIQPLEVIRLLLVLFLAGWFAERWQLLRELDEPRLGGAPWLAMLRLPRLRHALPVAIGVAAAIAFFFLQRDLGPALILVGLFLSLYAVSRGGVVLAAVGLLAIVLAFALGHVLGVPATVSLRTSMWLSPWENGLARGDQIAHALWSFGAGGFSGTGLGLGLPALAPAAHTDLILAAVGEELGFVGVLACLVLYALLVARGFRIARRAPDPYTMFLALGITVGLALQVLLIAGGVLGLVPLSGVVTPFLSYGRSALILHFAGLGILWSISASANEAGRLPTPEPFAARPFTAAFAAPLHRLGLVLAALGAVVVLKAAWVQVGRADQVLGHGSLALQADGELRYQYNPRLLVVAGNLPRGSVFDRRGIPLATSRWSELESRRAEYRRLGIDLDRACSKADERHYPFGGATLHLLGDAVSRSNWGASNTAFLERSADAFLSGYDDHARAVTIVDPRTSRPRRVVRRDLDELVPLWRHRYQPRHPAVVAFRKRNRNVRTTIDVRLQLRAMRLLRDRVSGAGLERGAVVVLDAVRGDVLACASWPSPEGALRGRDHRLPAVPASEGIAPDEGPLFDRARFGLYPPGSTFKLVTAAAALGRDPKLASAAFTCREVAGGRAGAIVAGRLVRDDETDHAHGTLAMEEATIVSCNAYYAQLARRIGWSDLAAAAARFGITVGDPGPSERTAHLIESAYGQAQVVASPYRMARVAAAIANGGEIPPERWTRTPSDSTAGVFAMDAAVASTLARYMRGVVERGTARRLAGVRPAIAGKTGTAEVANEPSHSWFVGYAPHGSSRRPIAFAVLIENGGYGGGRAAELAGELVAAARELEIPS